MGRGMRSMRRALALAVVAPMALAGLAQAQEPEVVDPDLAVRTAVSGLSQPISNRMPATPSTGPLGLIVA